MKDIIVNINDIVWGAPALVLILGVGGYLSLRLGLVQVSLFPEALRQFFRQLIPGKAGKAAHCSIQIPRLHSLNGQRIPVAQV